jgi:type I restriction enzyme S subunit
MKYKFGEIFHVVDGDRGANYPKEGDFFDEGFCLFLNAGNVTKTGWSFNKVSFITKEKDSKLRKGRVERGDTVLTTRGTVGNAAYYGDSIKYDHIRINSGMVILKAKDKQIIDDKFIYYLVTSPIAKKTIELFCSGSAQPQLPIKDFIKIKYDLPSLKIQKKIVSIIGSYDNLIENNNRRIRLLEQMAENLYKEWFVRFRFPGHEKAEFENGLPKSWKVEKVKSIVKRLPFNRTYKEYELEKEGAVIVIDQSTDDYLGYHNNEPSHYANYDDPLLLFGDHSCKFQLMTRNFSLGENVIPFTTNNKSLINEYWLFYASHKLIQTEEYKRHWGRFVSIKVLVPDINIQLRFENIVKTFEKEKNQLITKNSILSRQRDLLLPRLMSGKLEVNV